MMDKMKNRERIHAVENSFGPLGRPLFQPGRVLIGEGQLMKQGRRGPKLKVFYLFNDVLVYGGIILRGHWHKNQQIIPLEDIQLEDLEDDARLTNQWLIHTLHKSFHIAAASYEEKRAWIEHMEECRSKLLQSQSGSHRPGPRLPDQASAVCARCSHKFGVTQRRHRCSKCGCMVCSACSKKRAVIAHIHPTKRLRVCRLCHGAEELVQEIGHQAERRCGRGGDSGEDEGERSSEEEEAAARVERHHPSSWFPVSTANR